MVRRPMRLVVGIVLVIGFAMGAWWLYARTSPMDDHGGKKASRAVKDEHGHEGHNHDEHGHDEHGREDQHDPDHEGTQTVRLSREAQANLNLVAKPLKPATFWRSIDLPGVIDDRPGITDRGVVAPVTGVVTAINAYPGDTVAPNAPLFTVRLVSESLHASQLEFFKATREIEIARRQLARLSDVAQSGALPQSRIIDIENQIQRLEVNQQAYRQDLHARGLPKDALEAVAKGDFVAEIKVRAPQVIPAQEVKPHSAERSTGEQPAFAFEIQTLDVELGQQVQTGQVLCYLADHRYLFIEGQAFKDDIASVQEAARQGWRVEVDYGAQAGNWPALPDRLPIHHVANIVDPTSRTIAFYLSLDNQWQAYEHDGAPRVLWRFRPGTRVRLRVPVEKLEGQYVLPRAAVIQEGPDAYVFRQDGDHFDRIPVQVLHETSRQTVVASGGALKPDWLIVQNSAASLNRVLKSLDAGSGGGDEHDHHDH